MSEIRRATPKIKNWRQALGGFSSDKISNPHLESYLVDSLLQDREYPFLNQEIIKGEFDYQLESPHGEVTSIPMEFSFRTGTKLFILNPGQRDNLTNQVIHELRSVLANEVSILPGASVSLTGIWNFIQSADEIREIQIQTDWRDTGPDEGEGTYGNESTIPYDRLPPQEIIGKRKVRRADLVFRYEGRFDVIYSEDVLSANAGEDQFEYVVQTFETEAIYNG